jgi:acetyl-CoA acetyltransferase
VADGRLRLGGALPTNTDGGGLSACHPGMRGMFLLVEATRQLRGEAGERQVPGAEVACVHGTGGWFSSGATVILGADR